MERWERQRYIGREAGCSFPFATSEMGRLIEVAQRISQTGEAEQTVDESKPGETGMAFRCPCRLPFS